MARFRARRRSGRTGGARRKVRWTSSFLGTTEPFALNQGDKLVGWLKWPAGHVDTRFVDLPIEPSDETLVRTIVWPYLTVNGPPEQVLLFTWGIIAWDSNDPSALDGVLLSSVQLEAPDPAFGGDDWIWYYTQAVASPSGADFGVMQNPGAETYVTSRAMRKLPPSTGLLAVISMNIPNPAPLEPTSVMMGIQTRQALKSGYTP